MSAAPPLLDRLLALPGPAPQEALAAERTALARLLLLHLAARGWQLAINLHEKSGPRWWALAAALTLLLLVGWPRRLQRAALAGAFGASLLGAVWTLPALPNHLFLELGCAALLALVGEGALALQGVRWLALLVLFWSGVQKVWAGTWFDGQFLAVALVRDVRFGDALGWLVPEAERARLSAMGPVPATGSGPWRLSGVLAWAGNAVWLAELTLPVAMLVRRLRPLAALGALGLLVAFELVARELFFGGLMVGLLLGLVRPGLVRRALLPLALVYLGTLAAELWRPEWRLN